MKRLSNNKERRAEFTGFEVLTFGEMIKIRGGGDTKPASREKDLYEKDPDDPNVR